MKVAVIGSGAGGCALAFDYAWQGHQVSLCDLKQFPEQIQAIKDNGLTCEGALKGEADLHYAGFDFSQALEDAELVFMAGPAYSTEPLAKAAREYFKSGQMVVICPSSCGGALVFKQVMGREADEKNLVIAETSTLPYAVRILEPGKIRIFNKLPGGIYSAALPAKDGNKVLNVLREVLPGMQSAKNVMQTSLQNGNYVIHPAVTLLNAALIERTRGISFFTNTG